MFLLQVALIDQDKGNIMDIKNKKYVRAIPVWGGACSSDGRYGKYFSKKILISFLKETKLFLFEFLFRSVCTISWWT